MNKLYFSEMEIIYVSTQYYHINIDAWLVN